MPLDPNHVLVFHDRTTKQIGPETKIATGNLTDGSVTAFKLAADSVGAFQIAAGAVGTTELAAGAVTAAKVAADVATQAELDAATAQATDLARGTIELATQAEVNAHTDATRAVTPDTLSGATVRKEIVYSLPGAQVVGGGSIRLYFQRAATITNLHVAANTAPTGASLIYDANKNGTTIFTTQANRPTIAVSTNVDATSTPNVTAFAAGDYMTIDTDQIGSTVAGSDVTVTVSYTETFGD